MTTNKATIIDTPEGMAVLRLLTLRAALRLEVAGMSRSRSPSAYSILKGMGYKGRREVVLATINEQIRKAKESKQ